MNNMVISSTLSKLVEALNKAQSKMSNAIKDSKNPFFKSKYADLNAVREACLPALLEQGFVVAQPIIQKDGKSFVRTLLLLGNEYLGSDTEIVCAKQNDPQAYGSAISYARRYGLQSLVLLGSEDDDSEGAMGRSSKVSHSKTTVELSSSPSQNHVVTSPIDTSTKPASTGFRKSNGSKSEWT